ncbi:hypothetical protein R1sor_017169 [Riccia sorocarpa]|uniref:Uncharacterized protein n=1 Tax=Riccia sorocarpa TaxID=122646 RepID=A0ABD3IA26_9MARC
MDIRGRGRGWRTVGKGFRERSDPSEILKLNLRERRGMAGKGREWRGNHGVGRGREWPGNDGTIGRDDRVGAREDRVVQEKMTVLRGWPGTAGKEVRPSHSSGGTGKRVLRLERGLAKDSITRLRLRFSFRSGPIESSSGSRRASRVVTKELTEKGGGNGGILHASLCNVANILYTEERRGRRTRRQIEPRLRGSSGACVRVRERA